MSESTCLLRSFSTPAETSGVAQQGNDPLRVLGESISFGRFLSESLDWEKWSAFSHKRYVEEAEKYSKPGSVAAKKAYFEAHYRRKAAAAAERAAAMVQEANAQASGAFGSETQEVNHADSAVMPESDADGVVAAANVQQDKDSVVDYQIVDCADTNQYKCDVGQSVLDISNVEGAGDVPHACTNESLNAESCIIVDDTNQFDHVEPQKKIGVPGGEKMPEQEAVDQEVLPVKGTEVNSSPKLSTKTGVAKLPHSLNERKASAALPPRSGINKKSVRVSCENPRLTAARSLNSSINHPSGNGETSKKAAAAAQSNSGLNSVSKIKKSVECSSVKKQISARSLHMSINLPLNETSKTAKAAVKPRNVIHHESKSMKSVGGSVKKQPTARSLHMSINLPSSAGETSNTVSVLEHNRIEKNHSNFSNISKDRPVVASQTSTKASHGFLNQAPENPLSQRRSERLLNKSVSGGVITAAKLSSISTDCLKSSSTKPRPLTISSPFRFRSEERAVKRKELLQRIDETKNKEVEKFQVQKLPKDKIEHDHKKLRQSSVFKSKLNEDRNGGSHSPSNQIRKASLLQLHSPKFGRKVSSGTFQDKNFGTSWKPPIKTNNSKTEKVNRITRHSGTSVSGITRENASPNIQH